MSNSLLDRKPAYVAKVAEMRFDLNMIRQLMVESSFRYGSFLSIDFHYCKQNLENAERWLYHLEKLLGYHERVVFEAVRFPNSFKLSVRLEFLMEELARIISDIDPDSKLCGSMEDLDFGEQGKYTYALYKAYGYLLECLMLLEEELSHVSPLSPQQYV